MFVADTHVPSPHIAVVIADRDHMTSIHTDNQMFDMQMLNELESSFVVVS